MTTTGVSVLYKYTWYQTYSTISRLLSYGIIDKWSSLESFKSAMVHHINGLICEHLMLKLASPCCAAEQALFDLFVTREQVGERFLVTSVVEIWC